MILLWFFFKEFIIRIAFMKDWEGDRDRAIPSILHYIRIVCDIKIFIAYFIFHDMKVKIKNP